MQVPDFATLHNDAKLHLVEREASTLLRLSRWPATELYFGRNKVSRFDDPLQQYGVAYAAHSLQVAFAETVLHESALYEDSAWIVPGSMLRERSIVYLEADRPLLAYSTPSRTPFRSDGGQHSTVMADTVPR